MSRLAIKLQCPFCGGNWTPKRTMRPKECIVCKRYFNYTKEGRYPREIEVEESVIREVKLADLRPIGYVQCFYCGEDTQKAIKRKNRYVCLKCIPRLFEEPRKKHPTWRDLVKKELSGENESLEIKSHLKEE